MKTIVAVLAVAFISAPVFAQYRQTSPSTTPPTQRQTPPTTTQPTTPPSTTQPGQPPQAMDMTRMGPATRLPKNESALRKEIESFVKRQDEMMKQPDLQASLQYIDFPIYMLTDDTSGRVMGKEYEQTEYTEMMRPFYDQMANQPQQHKVTHRPTYHFLSDAIVNVYDDYTMTTGRQKVNGRSSYTLVKKDGQWKYKSMTEAGWGEMAQGIGGTGDQPMHEEQQPMPQPMQRK